MAMRTFEVLLLSVLMLPLLAEASVQDPFFEISDVTCVSDPIKTAVQLPTNLQCAMHCLKTAGTDYNTCNGFSFDGATSSCLLCNDGANMDDRPDLEASPGSSVFARRFKTRCPPEWKFNLANGHCYGYQNDTKKTWGDAEDACVAFGNGTHLISIGDQEELNFLINITTKEVWIGATENGHWGTWIFTDGTPMTFTNWGNNQPDSDNKTGRKDEGRVDHCNKVQLSLLWWLAHAHVLKEVSPQQSAADTADHEAGKEQSSSVFFVSCDANDLHALQPASQN
ncbi:unnamed protein product, partial [Cyprideis torosa]